MPESKVRIGVIGFDHWYTAIPMVEQLASHPSVELAGIADPDPERARDAAVRAGQPDRVVETPEALIEDPSVDAIASFIEPGRNPEICVAAARHGKHLLSIKPLARTLEQADQVVAAVEEAGVSFMPAESRGRLAPANQQIRGWIDEGRFGRILTAYCCLWAPLPQRWPGDQDPGWFADPARTVGGAWIDHAIYQIDLLRWLTGQQVISAAGQRARVKYPDLAVEDYGVGTIRFAGGMLATIEDTWTAPPHIFRSVMTVGGSEGAFSTDRGEGKLSVTGRFEPFQGWVAATPPHGQADDLDHFAKVVRGEAVPIATVHDARANLAACLAFYEAAATGGSAEPRAGKEKTAAGGVA